jgi:RNA polymerase sigma-70 factor, ECF subfamily
MGDSDDLRLVKRLRARDPRAFRTFVDAHQDLVFNLVYRMLGDRHEAEDVSQEVFVTIFKAIDRFRAESKLSTWVYRIAVNHAKNRLKYLARRRADRRTSLDDVSEGELYRAAGSLNPRPDHLAMGHELEVLVQQAMGSLNDDYRLILVLRDIDTLSYEEITEITGLPMGTVKSRLHRARSALKEALDRLRFTGGERG